ncbi:hypothetical protein BKI52_20395 [marine bacterium AO1-C]|nr:hypothetical protein BKI52_20395 [marine bacterium AO1-C]
MKNFFAILSLLLINTIFIQVNAQCNVGGVSSLNQGQTSTYTATTQSGANYFWSTTGNLAIVGGNTSSTVSVQATGTGTGKVCYARYKAGTEPCATCKTVTVSSAPTCPGTIPIISTGPQCDGPSVKLTFDAPGPYTYNWSVSGAGAIILSNNGSYIVVRAIRNSFVTATASLVCNGQTVTASHTASTHIDCGGDLPFEIGPNPVNEDVKINIKKEDTKNGAYNVQVFNQVGEMVIRKTVKNHQKLDLSQLKKGTYFIRLFNNNQLIGTQRVIRE